MAEGPLFAGGDPMPGWQGSNRREQLPANWSALRRQVFRRDGYRCTATDPATGERCPEPAEECDHIGDNRNHDLANLRSLCAWHHSRRSGRQGAAAAAAIRRRNAKKFRRIEEHPGLT